MKKIINLLIFIICSYIPLFADKTAEEYNKAGIDKILKRDFQNAIIDFNYAIELNQDLSDAWNNKGICYDELGNKDEAIIYFNKAISIMPENVQAWNNKGIYFFKIGKFSKAFTTGWRKKTTAPRVVTG